MLDKENAFIQIHKIIHKLKSFKQLNSISSLTHNLPMILFLLQSNLDYPYLDYPDFSIILTFPLAPILSRLDYQPLFEKGARAPPPNSRLDA